MHQHPSSGPDQPGRDSELRSSGDHGHDTEHDGHLIHEPEHGHAEKHVHHAGPLAFIGEIVHLHGHDARSDGVLEGSADGIRTLRLTLLGLAVTAGIQLVIAIQSGSVGLLSDTIHNFSDALTAVPLWLAFLVSRRPANRRYTYGYGRAEDLAGVAIVVIIVASSLLALWESYQKLIHPTPLVYVGWVMVAALVGFLGNEGVAILRIRTGRRIGSAALEADGRHAQVDGLTSLGVLIGAVAVWLGAPIADPIVGLMISVTILFVSRDAALAMWRRLMDAVDPSLGERLTNVTRETPGVQGVEVPRVRWLGHRLWADLHILVDEDLSLKAAHAIAEDVRHRLFHAERRLADIVVHVDPVGSCGTDYHATTSKHQEP
ncbi:MAG TPA: cation diffusion facilitator family transporter [Chloroflexota bacterium]|nr:cation diffusion facilitator family transporter [Chloroflexota bacterium]